MRWRDFWRGFGSLSISPPAEEMKTIEDLERETQEMFARLGVNRHSMEWRPAGFPHFDEMQRPTKTDRH